MVVHTAYYGVIQRHEVIPLKPLMLSTPLANIVPGVLITHDEAYDARMGEGASLFAGRRRSGV